MSSLGLMAELGSKVSEVSDMKDLGKELKKDIKELSPSEIKETKSPLFELADKQEIKLELDKPIEKEVNDGMVPRSHGKWQGEVGNSKWVPDDNYIPKNRNYSNLEGKTWKEIKTQYKIDGIDFKNREPDFSEVSRGTVEIDEFTDARYGAGCNFDQAMEKLSKKEGYTKAEIKDWCEKNNYVWHERGDCKTMDKVPREVHSNISHSGGISKFKNM